MDLYMGVDIGTSGCKAAVFDESGALAAAAHREYDVISPQPGWAELNGDEVMDKCFAVIAEASGQAGGCAVRGLGISRQGEAFTPLDDRGKAMAGAMVSSDTRAAEYVESWTGQFGEQKLYEITGHTGHPMFSLFKLLWVRDHLPDVWAATRRFLCFEDLLAFRLGVDPAMGWSLAGRTMLFDVRRHRWSPEILDAIGLASEKLARALPSGTVCGNIAPRTARELGLGKGAFVAAGGHDQTCSALGVGAVTPGVAMYATGTAECIAAVFAEPVFSKDLQRHNLCTYDHTVHNMYATLAFSLTGGNLLKWFRDEFGQPEVAEAGRSGADAYELLLKTAGDRPSGVLVLPYFTPSGTPYFDTRTPGAILGLRLTTRRGDVLRGLLEGVAFEMRLNLEILERSGCHVGQLRATGGGARSDLWNQLKADVIGKEIVVPDVTETGCMGAALLAAAADRGAAVADLADRWVKLSTVKRPRPDRAEWYAERFSLYQQVRPALRALFAGV